MLTGMGKTLTYAYVIRLGKSLLTLLASYLNVLLSFFNHLKNERATVCIFRVPSDVSKLNKTFPVVEPYWLNDSHQESREAGTPGIRMTWIGHATVLMEVDGTLVLTDPIFSERASYVQWMGIKRYRPPGKLVYR